MPRDINDVYTLPAGNPVIPDTVIDTEWANNTMDDIAQALTDSLDKSDPTQARTILGLGTMATQNANGVAITGGSVDVSSVKAASMECTGNLKVASVNGGPLAGLRNLFLNPRFQVNQRGYVSGTPTTTANQYTLDRMRVVVSGQNLAFSTSGNITTITAPAGGVEQIIEGLNIDGGSYVLNWEGTATATVNGVARTKGEVFTLASGVDATIRFSSGTVSKVQLEAGNQVTPLEARPHQLELLLCQRYYLRAGRGWSGVANLSTNILISGTFPTTMRVNPTAAGVSGSGVGAILAAGGTATNLNTFVNIGAYQTGGWVYCGGSFSANLQYACINQILEFSAEL